MFHGFLVTAAGFFRPHQKQHEVRTFHEDVFWSLRSQAVRTHIIGCPASAMEISSKHSITWVLQKDSANTCQGWIECARVHSTWVLITSTIFEASFGGFSSNGAIHLVRLPAHSVMVSYLCVRTRTRFLSEFSSLAFEVISPQPQGIGLVFVRVHFLGV